MRNVFDVEVKYRNFSRIELSAVILNVKAQFKRDMFLIRNISQENYLSGPRPEKLGVVTNTLRSGIKSDVVGSTTQKKLIGSVGFGQQAWYGKLHEYGIGGQKKRSFLGPAINDHIDVLTENVLSSIRETLERI